MKEKLVASAEVYSPQRYVEMMTNKFYIGSVINGNTIEKDIQKLLCDNGIEDIKSFALDDIESAIKAGKRVVLVDCVHYNSERIIQEYRWFQINDNTYIEEE